MTKLDYTLQSPEERKQLVIKILEENAEPTNSYLETLTDYLVLPMEKQEKKQRQILTENRMATVNKRETSFEGLIAQLENGEDGIYNLINDSKQTIFQPKISITKKDLEDIPMLRQVREAIELWENKLRAAQGRDAYIIKKALIELRKDQYIIKTAYRCPVQINTMTHSSTYIKLEDTTHEFDADGYPIPEGVSLLNPEICSAILCNYSKLKENGWGNFVSDTWYLMEEFDAVSEAALRPYPIYERIVDLKIDGKQNVEIQNTIEKEFGVRHSAEYISSLWRNKIPKLLASEAEDRWLNYYYLEIEKGKYKKCTRCGQIKLAHNKYFSKNKTSKDHFYSICKDCRNARTKELKNFAVPPGQKI